MKHITESETRKWGHLFRLAVLAAILIGSTAIADDPGLKYDSQRHPKLKMGYNDLNMDGAPDTLIVRWNGKIVAFVSDSGQLPWGAKAEKRDWNAYFNKAFNVGQDPPVTWNPMRAKWGNYTILVDRDGDGRFDSIGDWYYKAIDIDGDGAPEGEYYHLFPGSYSNKLHFNFNGERDMSYLDFEAFAYGPDEQRYLKGGKYIMNVHGNGMFLNSYAKLIQGAWENPIAWYDLNFDGRTDMVMRAGDVSYVKGKDHIDYSKLLNEFEIAFELNSNTSEKRWHSLDMQLTFYQYDKAKGLDYTKYADRIPHIEGLKDAEFLSKKMADTRLETIRRYLPYMDGYRIAMDYDGWEGVWLLFDEDDDDNRWEEMFSRHEPAQGWWGYADCIGDRTEIDKDYKGKGKLYVARFDGRIHLFHAEFAVWDVDCLAMYKGAGDRAKTDEGPRAPAKLRYPRVRYSDTNGNGFIDKIEYMTVEYNNEAKSEKIERVVSLLNCADSKHPKPDVCDLFDPRVKAPVTGWTVAKWNGKPLTRKDFKGTPVKAGFDKVYKLYGRVCEGMWSDAQKLYKTAKALGLNRSENLDKDLKVKYTKKELAALKVLEIPKGYSRHLSGKTRREKYHNGYWLKEKVFTDILKYSSLDKAAMEKYFYTGRIDELCEYVRKNYKPKQK